MRSVIEIENIEGLRQEAGIDDVELREGIRRLGAGDVVRLTFLASGKLSRGETLLVRITSIRGLLFRGKLVSRPASAALADLRAGTVIVFSGANIHSLADGYS